MQEYTKNSNRVNNVLLDILFSWLRALNGNLFDDKEYKIISGGGPEIFAYIERFLNSRQCVKLCSEISAVTCLNGKE